MSLNSKITQEYFLLRNYKEYAFTARSMLLRMDFEAIERIDKSDWIVPFDKPDSEEAKKMIKSTIQLEIISKIMLFIEDLAIISESLRRGISYYDLLPQSSEPREDIGKIIDQFFTKIDSISNEEIRKILSYSNPEAYALDYDSITLLKRAAEEDVKEFRRVLKQIGDFGKQHHPIFRRYKHAGFPFNPSVPMRQELPDFMKKFDSLSVTYINADPFDNPKIIPYSKTALEGYFILILGIQRLLTEIVNNRISSIERQIEGIPPLASFTAPFFKIDEMKRLAKIHEELDKQFPSENPNLKLKMSSDFVDYSDWYSELDRFIAECKDRDKIDKIFREQYYKSSS